MEQTVKVIIVARPGPLRDALKALLAATSELKVAVEVCGPELMAGRRPPRATVVVLTGNPFGVDLSITIGRLRGWWPRARLLVLAEDAAQWREAKAAGADRVHFKGISPQKLVRAVERLV
ncbi:MAG: hypothetical protein XD60_0056 [Acetothermia bacterium 64_32]|nr:MAG: hypothetical protein XD60_0056 [Acetothermia bacterium 64_32]HAF70124.1 hypothetical protein [Candidatus Acetothermia bacterium]